MAPPSPMAVPWASIVAFLEGLMFVVSGLGFRILIKEDCRRVVLVS